MSLEFPKIYYVIARRVFFPTKQSLPQCGGLLRTPALPSRTVVLAARTVAGGAREVRSQ